MLRCPTCPYRNTSHAPVNATGPRPARVMIIAEAPGKDEVKQGRVLIGKTGQELDQQYLPMAGLQRDDVFCTNAMHCDPPTKSGDIGTPTTEQARACAAYFLPIELREVQPEIIVTIGAVATHALLGDDIDLEMRHGLPMSAPPNSLLFDMYHLGVGPDIIPTWHPAAGLRDGEWMIALQEDFRLLKRILRGETVYAVDVQKLYCNEIHSVTQLDYIMQDALDPAYYRCGYVGIDTESINGIAWCVTFSVHQSYGWFIDATRTDLLQRLAYWLDKFTIVLHNALADVPILAQMGLNITRWIDTMVLAYWAQEFRLGLKILGYRHCGLIMQDYSDVVKPPSKIELYAYVTTTITNMTRTVPDSRKVKSMTDVEKSIRKTRTLLKRLITDLDKDFTGVDPWKRIDKWEPATVEIIEQLGAGPIVRPNIALVDRDIAIRYASMDAIATLRLRPILVERARILRKKVA